MVFYIIRIALSDFNHPQMGWTRAQLAGLAYVTDKILPEVEAQFELTKFCKELSFHEWDQQTLQDNITSISKRIQGSEYFFEIGTESNNNLFKAIKAVFGEQSQYSHTLVEILKGNIDYPNAQLALATKFVSDTLGAFLRANIIPVADLKNILATLKPSTYVSIANASDFNSFLLTNEYYNVNSKKFETLCNVMRTSPIFSGIYDKLYNRLHDVLKKNGINFEKRINSASMIVDTQFSTYAYSQAPKSTLSASSISSALDQVVSAQKAQKMDISNESFPRSQAHKGELVSFLVRFQIVVGLTGKYIANIYRSSAHMIEDISYMLKSNNNAIITADVCLGTYGFVSRFENYLGDSLMSGNSAKNKEIATNTGVFEDDDEPVPVDAKQVVVLTESKLEKLTEKLEKNRRDKLIRKNIDQQTFFILDDETLRAHFETIPTIKLGDNEIQITDRSDNDLQPLPSKINEKQAGSKCECCIPCGLIKMLEYKLLSTPASSKKYSTDCPLMEECKYRQVKKIVDDDDE